MNINDPDKNNTWINDEYEGISAPPSVTTNNASSIDQSSSTLNGNVTSDGGASIKERGFYYSSTDDTPDSGDIKVTVSGTTGAYNKTITGLNSNTKYYFVAFATNSEGTSTGEIRNFTTSIVVKDRPTVTTSSAASISQTSATLNGNVTSDGGATITERGFYYSNTDDTPDSGDSKVTVSGTTGAYNKPITGLNSNTKYYFVAFATNSQGTSTGDIRDFTTSVVVKDRPSVTTNSATSINQTLAILNGNVTSDGGATITERGFYYSNTDFTPDSGDNKVAVSGTTGTYNKTITGLNSNTKYYFVSFATNSEGTSTGYVLDFTTGGGGGSGTYTDTRDGNSYDYKTIGTQTWMIENLAYLPSVSHPSTESATLPYYYVYGYEGSSVNAAKATTNYATYGVLYNWDAANTACPTGWHLPTDGEWTVLTDYLGSTAGKKMKTISGWKNNGNGDNSSGFNALPGGDRYYDGGGGFRGLADFAIFWSTLESGSSTAWDRTLLYSEDGVLRINDDRRDGFSVRCLKN